ncbi:hypothetical protein AVEN_115357-1 [Araneus ventricosus]|uniref:Uncharacterized protein n=1 Tax=Araneus ventricosus TaxID=182803 RepID=A0A4Y1ZZF3_ARAVE|nr:hypothetical protein AVEN_115357-1 [Araneus ventricosus]
MTRTTPELAPSSPNLLTPPSGGSQIKRAPGLHTRRIFSRIGFRAWNPPTPEPIPYHQVTVDVKIERILVVLKQSIHQANFSHPPIESNYSPEKQHYMETKDNQKEKHLVNCMGLHIPEMFFKIFLEWSCSVILENKLVKSLGIFCTILLQNFVHIPFNFNLARYT